MFINYMAPSPTFFTKQIVYLICFFFSLKKKNLCLTDDSVPEFTNTPEAIVAETDPGVATALVTWTEPNVTDNWGIFNLTASHTSGFQFSIGITTVTYTAVDAVGNIATYSFDVSVRGKLYFTIDEYGYMDIKLQQIQFNEKIQSCQSQNSHL